MAYLTVDQNADEYAKKQGLFTIKATGDSATITNKKSFKPRVFPANHNFHLIIPRSPFVYKNLSFFWK